jgi:hypothetical protein
MLMFVGRHEPQEMVTRAGGLGDGKSVLYIFRLCVRATERV